MKRYGVLLVALIAAVAAYTSYSIAQTNVKEFSCIGALMANCADGTTSLREYSGTNLPYVSVSGYFAPGDSGGGTYYRLGSTTGGSPHCKTTSTTMGSSSVGSTKITGLGTGATNGLTVGELVSASGTGIQTAPGTEIASIPSGGTSVIVTLPLIGTTGTSLGPVNFTGDNTGTLIVDAGGDCYQKTNYRGDPHEFAAIGDGFTDDTVPLQYWFGAAGAPSTAFASMAQPPTNFGPWIATTPAIYKVSQPLVCPPNANIQAPANITSGSPGTGGPGSPPVTILAAPLPTMPGGSGFQDTLGQPALMMAGPYCRISGIALDATKIGDFYLSTSATATNNSTSLTVGSSSGAYPGMPITDLNGYIPAGTSVYSASGTSIVMTQPASCPMSGCLADTATITGFYTLDVAGTHVGIDSHSVLQGGYDNVYCADSQLDGLQVNNAQIFKAWHDGVHITSACDNIRLIADIFQSNGKDGTGAGVWFSGQDLTLADGIVEQSGGPGLFITNADQADITGMVFAGNNAGVTFGQAPNIRFDGSADITFCGNRIQGSGSDTASTSAVLFSGVDDNINLCGNAYTARNGGSDTNVLPLYDYDIPTPPLFPPTITNTHIYETAARPALSVFTGPAQPLLQPLLVPQFSQGEFSGLTLSNGGTAQQINVAPGAAADSTNSTIISLPSSCTVDLSTNGAGGLDTGVIAASTTYYIFVIAPVAAAPGSAAPPSSCMASKSQTPPTPTIPVFSAAGFTGTGYQVATNTAGTLSGGGTIFNVSPLAGVVVGDPITSTDGSLLPTTITGFSANDVPGPTTGTLTSSSANVTIVATSGTIQVGMAIQDVTNNCIPAKAYITMVALPTVTMSKMATCTTPLTPPDTLSISGALQLGVSPSTAALTLAPAQLVISTGYYRMVGAVYTTSSLPAVLVSFTQNNDTFYLNPPAADVNNVTLSSGPNTLGPLSVPNNIVTEAFGRCVATGGMLTNYVELYTPSTLPGSGANFPTVPGYAATTVASSASVNGVSFPYRLHTDTSRHIDASATSGSPVLNCMTDGWVLHRAQ